MKKSIPTFLLALPLLLPALSPRAAGASEIPLGLPRVSEQAPASAETLRQAGLTEEQVASLDKVEVAQLEKSDPNRKGGDAVVTVAVIAAIVIIVWLVLEKVGPA